MFFLTPTQTFLLGCDELVSPYQSRGLDMYWKFLK